MTLATGIADGAWYNCEQSVELSASDGAEGCGVAALHYAIDGAAPVTVQGASVVIALAADVDAHADDGTHTIAYWATDAAGNVEVQKSVQLNIDTQGPTTRAPRSVSVRRGRVAVLRFSTLDAQPSSGIADVTIRISDHRGRVVKTLPGAVRGSDGTGALRFRCRLPKGVYRFSVFAVDAAGNTQAKLGGNRLRVR